MLRLFAIYKKNSVFYTDIAIDPERQLSVSTANRLQRTSFFSQFCDFLQQNRNGEYQYAVVRDKAAPDTFRLYISCGKHPEVAACADAVVIAGDIVFQNGGITSINDKSGAYSLDDSTPSKHRKAVYKVQHQVMMELGFTETARKLLTKNREYKGMQDKFISDDDISVHLATRQNDCRRFFLC